MRQSHGSKSLDSHEAKKILMDAVVHGLTVQRINVIYSNRDQVGLSHKPWVTMYKFAGHVESLDVLELENICGASNSVESKLKVRYKHKMTKKTHTPGIHTQAGISLQCTSSDFTLSSRVLKTQYCFLRTELEFIGKEEDCKQNCHGFKQKV